MTATRRATKTAQVNHPLLGRISWPLLLAIVMMSGGPAAAHATPAEPTEQGRSRVVIAAIELNAPNMYHEFFYAGGPLYQQNGPTSVSDSVLKEFGIDAAHTLRMTRTGNVDADIAADAAQFESVRPGEAYWYEGTNVIGVSFAPQGKRLRSDLNAFGALVAPHATAVVAAALQANPEAVIVAIQAPNAKPLTATGEELSGSIPAELSKPSGEKWAFNHPAVDIVNTSYGNRYNAPYGDDLLDGYEGVVEKGKMHFGGPHNSETPIFGSNSSGPWWTVAVGGYYEGEGSFGGNEYRHAGSGMLPDIIADYTLTIPLCVRCQTGMTGPGGRASGASFSAARAAGTVSSVVLEARRALNHKGGIRLGEIPLMVQGHGQKKGMGITVWQVRRAMEEAAVLPEETVADPASWDSIPGAPWLTHAWGAVSPEPALRFVEKSLAHLGIAGVPDPMKSSGACAFQTAGIRMRQAYWNHVAPFSGSAGTTADPFLYCKPF